MRILIALLALLALMPFGAHAACPVGAEVVQDTVTYAFGKAEKNPDLRLKVSVPQAGYIPWNGIGRSIYEDVSFADQGITYLVWYAVDRMIDAHPTSGGIVVSQGDTELARLSCDENTVITGFGALYDRMTALGQCWDYETHAWGGCS